MSGIMRIIPINGGGRFGAPSTVVGAFPCLCAPADPLRMLKCASFGLDDMHP